MAEDAGRAITVGVPLVGVPLVGVIGEEAGEAAASVWGRLTGVCSSILPPEGVFEWDKDKDNWPPLSTPSPSPPAIVLLSIASASELSQLLSSFSSPGYKMLMNSSADKIAD